MDLKALRQPDVPGTLVTGLGGPQPPAALSTAVIGMKKGGKVCRSLVSVWPDALSVDISVFSALRGADVVQINIFFNASSGTETFSGSQGFAPTRTLNHVHTVSLPLRV